MKKYLEQRKTTKQTETQELFLMFSIPKHAGVITNIDVGVKIFNIWRFSNV